MPIHAKGKGLQAAMRVSMLIGAVRLSPELAPAALLARLNEVLLWDGSSSFTTCLAARLATDGSVTIANAGHLPPYLSGRELPIRGDLPLGVAPEADYTEQAFPFAVGDALLLLSERRHRSYQSLRRALRFRPEWPKPQLR